MPVLPGPATPKSTYTPVYLEPPSISIETTNTRAAVNMVIATFGYEKVLEAVGECIKERGPITKFPMHKDEWWRQMRLLIGDESANEEAWLLHYTHKQILLLDDDGFIRPGPHYKPPSP